MDSLQDTSASTAPGQASTLSVTRRPPSHPSDPVIQGQTSLSSPLPTDGSILPQQQQDSGSITRFAFFFLIVFIAFLFFGFWVVHRNRMRRKAALRVSGQDALARDLDGWVNSRRWVNGAWRTDPTQTRDDEGLDERGDAPPPYQSQEQPPAPLRMADNCYHPLEHDPGSTNGGGFSANPAAGLAIPLRTLSQRGGLLKPPDYQETLRPVRGEASRSPIAEPPRAASVTHPSVGSSSG